MIPAVNIPAQGGTAFEIMGATSMWGVPTDITAGMLGGQDFVTRALTAKPPMPPVTTALLRRLQRAFDNGEACFPK